MVLHRFEYRPNSGGDGEFRGGDGLIREFEYTKACHASVLTQRRVYSPYGMAGGEDGLRGENLLGRKMQDGSLRWVNVGGTKEVNLNAGDRIAIHTPGGGGYGGKAGVAKVASQQTTLTNGYNAKGAVVQVDEVYQEPVPRANGRLSNHLSNVASSF